MNDSFLNAPDRIIECFWKHHNAKGGEWGERNCQTVETEQVRKKRTDRTADAKHCDLLATFVALTFTIFERIFHNNGFLLVVGFQSENLGVAQLTLPYSSVSHIIQQCNDICQYIT
jgi:hypothetical protein